MAQRQDQILGPGSGPSVLSRRFVRVIGRRGAFVEFEFAIGEPELRVELVLPPAAFAEFCRENDVVVLEGACAADARDWSMRRAAAGAVPEDR